MRSSRILVGLVWLSAAVAGTLALAESARGQDERSAQPSGIEQYTESIPAPPASPEDADGDGGYASTVAWLAGALVATAAGVFGLVLIQRRRRAAAEPRAARIEH